MSILTWLLVTGSKASVVGWPDAVAQVIRRFFTGTKRRPSQYDTVIEAGRVSVAFVVKLALTVPNVCGARPRHRHPVTGP